MTGHCAGKNYKELTIKIYVDARPVSLLSQLRVWSSAQYRGTPRHSQVVVEVVVVVVFLLIIIILAP